MTNKEYKEKRESIETYSCRNYLDGQERSELLKDVKERDGFQLGGFNNRATMKRENGVYTLTSYYTDVCEYNTETGEFFKLWDGFSTTTLKHVNIFRKYLGIPEISKREWIELPCY